MSGNITVHAASSKFPTVLCSLVPCRPPPVLASGTFYSDYNLILCNFISRFQCTISMLPRL